MSEYHKIDTMFKRDMASKFKNLIEGEWARPEFEYLANNQWSFTEKVDGTNIRVTRSPSGGFQYGGRAEASQMPATLVRRLDEVFRPLEQRFQDVFDEPDTVVLYGEGYGARIQKGGGNYRPTQDLVLFDVRVGKWWLQRTDLEDVASKLGLDVVPVIGRGTLHDAVRMAKDGIRSTWGDFAAEGIVARPVTELNARNGDRIITKIKSRDFRS